MQPHVPVMTEKERLWQDQLNFTSIKSGTVMRASENYADVSDKVSMPEQLSSADVEVIKTRGKTRGIKIQGGKF